MVLAAELLPANAKENVALAPLHEAIMEQGHLVGVYDFDRGYVASDLIPTLQADGIKLVSKPWTSSNKGRFTKRDFRFNLRDKTVTCPAGQSQRYTLGRTVQFDHATSCVLAALLVRTHVDVACSSTSRRNSKSGSVGCRRRKADALGNESEFQSNIASPTLRIAKVSVPATSAVERTSTTSDATPPS